MRLLENRRFKAPLPNIGTTEPDAHVVASCLHSRCDFSSFSAAGPDFHEGVIFN